MSALLALLVGLLLGQRIKVSVAPPQPGAGDTPPQPATPPKWDEQPPAPPEGWQRHPEPMPVSVAERAQQIGPALWALGAGTRGGPEVRDWRNDGRPYSVLFRADFYRGQRIVGAYVEQSAAKQPPAQPPEQVIPLPGGWRAHPAPIPASVVQTAWGLLSKLWSQGQGAHEIQARDWRDDGKMYEILFRAEKHAPGDKRGVTAYVRG